MHVLDDGAVVLLAHEPGERGKRAHREHLQIGQLALADGHLGEMLGFLGRPLGLPSRKDQVDQRAAVWGNGLGRAHGVGKHSVSPSTDTPDERPRTAAKPAGLVIQGPGYTAVAPAKGLSCSKGPPCRHSRPNTSSMS